MQIKSFTFFKKDRNLKEHLYPQISFKNFISFKPIFTLLLILSGLLGSSSTALGQCGCTNCPQNLPDGAVEDFFVNVWDDPDVPGDECMTSELTSVNIIFDHEYLL